ncbi:hypothetical protein QAD02_014581 [Eretmocerus hayati]|uniref:Uncharacterized protein n=1 Tax=Eretmocerus hayati TaxID=131215 RepID=A0ACC2P6A8_9HYME|nr:hypothetical protein QAD02_014581 [Eretmocerus hayati]
MESGYSSLNMSPVSSLGISPGAAVAVATHHQGYASPGVTPSPTTPHPHAAATGGLSPVADVKPHCANTYPRDIYDSEFPSIHTHAAIVITLPYVPAYCNFI